MTTRRNRRLAGTLAATTGAALLLAACGGGEESDSTPQAATTGTPAQTAPAETTEEHGTTGAEHEATGAAISSPASDLRITLDRLLAEHADLAMLATQKGLAGAQDFEAIAAALDANAVEISEAIGSIYGAEAAKEFLDGDLKWRDHIGFFVDYTVGLAKDDTAAKKEAVGNLMGYIEAFSNFLATATGLPQGALRDGLTEHVNQLKGQIDAYDAGNYEQAYASFRDAYHHMVMTGDALAAGIAEQQGLELAPATEQASDLRSTLGTLLGEHAILAMAATQKGFDGDPDFEAAAAALDANSVAISEAIGSVYGDEAAKQFLDGDLMWRDHIGFFVDYTVGLAMDDKAAQDEAVGNLMGYVEASSNFLATATGLPQDALRETLTEHVMQLKGQIDAYAAGDYETAYADFRDAYAHMYMTADALAGAALHEIGQ
jgi:hypothetical protein